MRVNENNFEKEKEMTYLSATEVECFQCGKAIGPDDEVQQRGHMYFCSVACDEIEAAEVKINDIDLEIAELEEKIKSLKEDKRSLL